MKNKRLEGLRLFSLFLGLGGALLLSACGGGSNTVTQTPTNTSNSSAPITVNFGDAPLSGVLAFEITVNNVTLSGTSGSATVLSTPVKIEVSHLAGTFEPLSLIKIPAGTYSQVSISLGAAEVLFLPAGSSTPVHKDIPAPSAPIIVTLNPPLVVSTTAASLNIDLNLASSLAIDASGQNVTFMPAFTAANNAIGGARELEEEENGELEDVHGSLVSATASSLTLKVGTQSLTFVINSSTILQPTGLNLATLPAGSLLEVDAFTQTDGTLVAKKVEFEMEDAQEMETEGLVTSVTGNPVTQFQLVTHEVNSPTATAPALGSSITVNVSSNTKFEVKVTNNFVVPGGLLFNASNFAPGQSVEADADSTSTTLLAARRVRLHQQALDGMISALTGGSFVLTVDPNSAFAKLTGKTTLNVNSASIENKTGAALANGQTARVRGFLFFSGGTYQFVAVRVQRP